MRPLRLGTRGSKLALRQAELVRDALCVHHPGLVVELVTITTRGDRLADVPLQQISGQGVFARALEDALLAGTIDCAVHSLKDLPGVARPGLVLAAFPPREDARDALVARTAPSFAALPHGARVATSSPRRAAQLLAARPDLEIVPIRGNVDTRLRKLAEQQLDATVLAVAGLQRLGLAEWITEALPLGLCLPAVGQGALAVQGRAGDTTTQALVAPLDDAPTRAAVEAERGLLAALGGGCRVPIAGHATVEGTTLRLQGLLAAPDGRTVLRDQVTGPTEAAAALGRELAERLLAAGGAALVAAAATSSLDPTLEE
ncbi:MAG: hydroxymethylbilane synthase [Chloroflexi bacterium]|nr:hydroxymethylbilane synthase [Chloroflexota bacterium]